VERIAGVIDGGTWSLWTDECCDFESLIANQAAEFNNYREVGGRVFED
jgi:hypothetical protein